MLLILFSRLSGNFDSKNAVLLWNTLSFFFSEFSVLNFIHSDDQCQLFNFFLKSVGNHNGRIEIVEGRNKVDVFVSSSSEKANSDQLHNSCFFSYVGMRFVDFNDFFFLYSVPSVLFSLLFLWLLSRNVCCLLGLILGF